MVKVIEILTYFQLLYIFYVKYVSPSKHTGKCIHPILIHRWDGGTSCYIIREIWEDIGMLSGWASYLRNN